MAQSAYEITETVGELEERATFETRKSALNRITALKLYSLFTEAGEPNPIEFTANAVGVKTASVEKWLSIYAESGLEGLLRYGNTGHSTSSGKKALRRSASKPASARRSSKKTRRAGAAKAQAVESVDVLSSEDASDADDRDWKATDRQSDSRQDLQPGDGERAAAPPGSGGASSRPAASIEQDSGAVFHGQVSPSTRREAESESIAASEKDAESADESAVVRPEESASGNDPEPRTPRNRKSLARTARRARVRARASRRSISRIRPRRTKRGDAEKQDDSGRAPSRDAASNAEPPQVSGVARLVRDEHAAASASLTALPTRSDRPAYSPKEQYSASSGYTFASARVLIAEPDDLITDIIRHRLEKQGAKVTSATDGVEVVSRFWSTTFDLVIVAAALPGLDGFEITRWLRDHQTNSTVPILITSWPGNESDLVRAFHTGADDFLRKPFSPEEMVARSRRLLERVGGWQPSSTEGQSFRTGTKSSDD